MCSAANQTTGGTTITCSNSGGGCNCAATLMQPTMMHAGTYTTSGNSLTTVDTMGGGSGTNDYCIQGNTLHVLSMALPMGTMGMVISDIMATKQQ
jgi:hypothetical protein